MHFFCLKSFEKRGKEWLLVLCLSSLTRLTKVTRDFFDFMSEKKIPKKNAQSFFMVLTSLKKKTLGFQINEQEKTIKRTLDANFV